MGLDPNGTRFLLYAQRLGVDFEQTAMIGRQSLDLTRSELRDALKAFGHPVEHSVIDAVFNKNHGYAETLLAHLGAKEVHSFDFSAYEGATYLHDMNREIPPAFRGQYSVVLDGGSLEHIFNFPVAMKNCMEMLRLGGCYLGILPANNFMGHGFYQFSPELYFSVFTERNGFHLTSLIMFEDKPRTTWYSVRSPMEIKDRVSLINDEPVYLLAIAKRVALTPIFKSTPQQSDYAAAWDQEGGNKRHSLLEAAELPKSSLFRKWIKRNLPFPLRHLLQGIVQGRGFNPRFFQPMDPTKANR